MKINLSGQIVSKIYDCEIFADMIERGLICPSSRAVSAFAALEDGETAEVFVNSPGGDCFAGAEIVISLVNALKRGCKCAVEVGAEACSMAANLVAAVKANGGTVTAHRNSAIMFHSCYTEAAGGPQGLEDRAELLRNVNGTVIDDLARIGITDCRAWFAEGREKWLDAAHALEIGLIDSIVEDEAEKVDISDAVTQKLAAFVAPSAATETPEPTDAPASESTAGSPDEPTVESLPTESPAEEPTPSAPSSEESTASEGDSTTSAPEAQPAAPTEAEIEARVTALANERFAKLQSAHDRKISDLVKQNDTLAADLAAAKAEATSLRESVAKLEAGLAESRDQLAAEKSAHESIVAHAISPKSVSSWTAAYREANASRRNHKL